MWIITLCLTSTILNIEGIKPHVVTQPPKRLKTYGSTLKRLNNSDAHIDTNSTSFSAVENDAKKLTSRSLAKTKDFSYHYDPPVRHYIPTFGDDTSTQIPISEDEYVNQPPFHDEPDVIIPQSPTQGYNYDPPQIPFDDLRPPVSHDEVPNNNYLPIYPSFNLKEKKVTPLHLEVNEMHCFETPTDGRFQAQLTLKSKKENLPVFEDMLYDGGFCNLVGESPPPNFDTYIHMNISKDDFQRCGVKDCSSGNANVDMCVRLRFPTMSRLRLPEDPVLTLHCKTQDRVVSHVKHLKIDVDNSIIGRSGGVVAKGGNRGTLRTRVALYRKGPRGDYTEILPPRARVALGDIMMLKADVEPGDGWTSSRFSSVVMRRENSANGNNNQEVTLLRSDGCRDHQAHLLCPKEPVATSPLRHTLFLRAALFEGMNSGEEVRLSVRLVACLEAEECHLPRCDGEDRSRNSASRIRRSSGGFQTANSTSEVSFAIVMPTDLHGGDRQRTQFKGNGVVVCATLVLFLAVACAVILLILKKNKARARSPENNLGARKG